MLANLKYPGRLMLTALSVVWLCGCATVLNHWRSEFNPSPPPPRSEYRRPEPARRSEDGESQARTSVRPARPAHHPARPAGAARASVRQPGLQLPAPTAAPTVTLAGEGSGSAVTARSLDATANQIAHIKRASLNSSDAAAYDQVNGFLKAGREALERRDYVVASGFAQKASALVNRLPGGPAR
ncbi:MAG: hypothetical protein ACREQN_05150 [Candidatus Binataceae bacterium]